MLNYSEEKLISEGGYYLWSLWKADYERITQGSLEITHVNLDGFSYMFDISAERLVGGWGESQGRKPRLGDKDRQEKYPASPNAEYQKGHLFAQVLGGGVDINLVHQRDVINNGPFKSLEYWAKKSPGALYFVYCKYLSASGQRPAFFEQGLLVPGKRPDIRELRN